MTDMNILFVASVVHEKLLIEILKTQPILWNTRPVFHAVDVIGIKG